MATLDDFSQLARAYHAVLIARSQVDEARDILERREDRLEGVIQAFEDMRKDMLEKYPEIFLGIKEAETVEVVNGEITVVENG
jgi:hypothetical protein